MMKTTNIKTIKFFIAICFPVISCSPQTQIVDPKPVNDQGEEHINTLVFDGEATLDRLTDNEDRFYISQIPNTEVEVVLKGDCNPSDSQLLNQEITKLSNAGGGIIKIKKGSYCFRDVILKSNIHIKIDPDVTIQPNLSGKTKGKNIVIFVVGEDFFVENVAITNIDENNTDRSTWFKANIPVGDYGGVKFIEFGNVKNFKLSGLSLTDNYSKFSNIVLNLPSSLNRNEISTHGIIKNIVMTNMHVGYGVIQMQTGKTILCKNIDGKGGVTMRVETGAAATNLVNKKTVDDIVVRDITIRYGDASMNFSPHRVDQGRVDVERVIAINSTYAVQLAAGFLDKKGGVDNIGTFDSRSYVGDITVTGGDGAQIKSKDYKYFNCESRKELILKCSNPDNESTSGKSIGVVRDNSSFESGCTNGSDGGCYEVIVGKITKTNTDFEQEDFFIYPGNSVNGCPKVDPPSDGNCN